MKTFLIEKMKKAYDTPEYQEFAEKDLVNIRPGFLDAEGFAAYLQKEYDAFNQIALETGLKK